MAVDTSLHQLTPIFVYDKVAVHPLLMGVFGATVYVPPTPEVHVAVTPKPMYVRAWKPEKTYYTFETTSRAVVYVGVGMPKQTAILTPGASYWPDGSGKSGLLGDVDLLYVVKSALDSATVGRVWTLSISSDGYVTVGCDGNIGLDFSSLDSDFPAEILGFVSGNTYPITAGVPITSPNPSSLVWAPNRPWQRDTGDLSKPVGASVQTVGGASRGYMLAQTAERTITHQGLSLASVTGTWGLSDQLGYWKEAPVRIYPDQGDPNEYRTYTLISGEPSLASTLLPRYDAELRFSTYTPAFTSDYALSVAAYAGTFEISSESDLPWTGAAFTMSFWVYALSSADGPILQVGSGSDRCLEILKVGSTLTVGVADSASTVALWTSAADTLTVGTWTHIVVSFDGFYTTTDKLKVFRNGVDVTASGTFGSWAGVSSTVREATSGALDVGRVGSAILDGYIDDVCYWRTSSVRQTTSASAIYAGGVPSDMRRVLPQSPTCFWRFERDLGDTMGTVDLLATRSEAWPVPTFVSRT